MPNFANPYFLAAGLLAIPVIWLYWNRSRRGFPSVLFSQAPAAGSSARRQLKPKLRFLPPAAKVAALLLLAIALARPQSVHKGEDVYSEGIDIVLALDISASMLAQDFTPDRVQAAKVVAANFIRQRPNDRIGVIVFAKQAFTQCPLTIDHATLLELLNGVEVGLADPDNTAIGQALASALNRLKDSESKSKVIILLTDGENNFGLPPTTAAEAAEALGVHIYTIGVGTRGTAPYPTRDIFGRSTLQRVNVSIDEDLLMEIANSTGARYFRATDNEKLRQIFDEIDRMEKTRVEVRAFRRYAELFYPWAMGGLALLTLGLVTSAFLLKGLT